MTFTFIVFFFVGVCVYIMYVGVFRLICVCVCRYFNGLCVSVCVGTVTREGELTSSTRSVVEGDLDSDLRVSTVVIVLHRLFPLNFFHQDMISRRILHQDMFC